MKGSNEFNVNIFRNLESATSETYKAKLAMSEGGEPE